MVNGQVIYDIILHHMCHHRGDVGPPPGPPLQQHIEAHLTSYTGDVHSLTSAGAGHTHSHTVWELRQDTEDIDQVWLYPKLLPRLPQGRLNRGFPLLA